MPALFKLLIRAADRDFFDGECSSLTVPISDGQVGILAFRAPMAAAVVPGKVTYRLKEGDTVTLVVGAGILMFENNAASLLLDSVERPEDVDAERAERAAQNAADALRASRTPQEKLQAQDDLRRAKNRLRAVRGGE